jgi:pilus assembly protein CpaF
MSALNTLVSEAVDIVVHTTRTPEGLRVSELVAVEDLSSLDATHFTVTDVFHRRPREPLRWTGNIPVRAGRALADAGYDVRTLLGQPPASRAVQ